MYLRLNEKACWPQVNADSYGWGWRSLLVGHGRRTEGSIHCKKEVKVGPKGAFVVKMKLECESVLFWTQNCVE